MRLTGRKTQWEGRFLRTVLLQYEDRKGSIREWEAVERIGADGVVIIAAITSDGNILLIRQYRPALDSCIVELPAGLIEPGEAPVDACKRELIEETGHSSNTIMPLSAGVISTGLLTENWHAMLALDARVATEDELKTFPPDETEDIEVVSIELEGAFDSLTRMEEKGDKVDIRIYGIAELARRKTNIGEV